MASPQITEVPDSFRQEVHQAEVESDGAKLLLLSLEIQGVPWESEASPLLSRALKTVHPGASWDRVILFTGHRVDGPNRKTPRFPACQEAIAREAIRQALEEQKAKSDGGALLGIAGGANGGDILFLEACQGLGIFTEMALALPPDQFAQASVENGDEQWIERFSMQLNMHSTIPTLAQSPDLPAWLQSKKDYDIWQRNNLWLLSRALSRQAAERALIALWDGATGDGPGGTEHMVSLAKARDMEFIWLKTKELFGLT